MQSYNARVNPIAAGILDAAPSPQKSKITINNHTCEGFDCNPLTITVTPEIRYQSDKECLMGAWVRMIFLESSPSAQFFSDMFSDNPNAPCEGTIENEQNNSLHSLERGVLTKIPSPLKKGPTWAIEFYFEVYRYCGELT